MTRRQVVRRVLHSNSTVGLYQITLRCCALHVVTCTHDTQLILKWVSSCYRPRGPLRESSGIALLFSLNLRILEGGRWSTPLPGRLYPGKDPVPIVQEAEWASEPVWIDAENPAPTGIRCPNLPARSESLYRLRHPGSRNWYLFIAYSACRMLLWVY
jgi:hypothetical protein